MRASRGMGAIRESKMPKAKKIKRKDNPDEVTYYAKGGPAQGLWDNIHAKRKRIAAGSGEKMRRVGSKGAPTQAALVASQTSRRSKNRKA
jgi:hypothetical protein